MGGLGGGGGVTLWCVFLFGRREYELLPTTEAVVNDRRAMTLDHTDEL